MNRRLLTLFAVVVLVSGARVAAADNAGEKLVRTPYETVRTAEGFTIGGVGFAGTPSIMEKAFRQLLKEPNALVKCKKLLNDATPSGQLYGLLGLRLLNDQQAFRTALPLYKNSRAIIPTMRGCIAGRTTAAEVAKQIEKGELK